MAYLRKTLNKKAPETSGKLLADKAEYLLFWRYTSKRPPRPRKWVPICVFIKDPDQRKRSYYLTWNGWRFAHSDARDQLNERHPEIAAEAAETLVGFNDRLIKPKKEEDDAY